MKKSLRRWSLVFTGSILVALIIAFLAPLFIGTYLSFVKFTAVTNATSNGIDNYIKTFSEYQGFVSAPVFTAAVTIITIISVSVFTPAIVYLPTRKLRGTDFLHTVFFMPSLTGGIVPGYTWQTITNAVPYNLNTALITDAKYGLFGLILLLNWQQVDYMVMTYIAGLRSVPPELIRMVQVDGASC